MRTILVAECDVLRRAEITALFDRCYHVIAASCSGEVLDLIAEFHPAAVLVGQGFAGDETLLVIEKTIAASPQLCVIVLSESGDMDFAVNALKAGAVTVITGMPAKDVLYSAVAGKVPPDDGSSFGDMPWRIKNC